jgi:hypothetical protein
VTRTYGTYRYQPFPFPTSTEEVIFTDTSARATPGQWVLTLEPAVRMRARRTLGKVALTRSIDVTITDTTEVCRDLEWFMQRWPLEAADALSEERLRTRAEVHATQERKIGAILSGTQERLHLPTAPLKTPRDYQLVAVDLLRASKSLLITDEVGLGKTFTGLLNLVHGDALPAVIVPPTHLPKRWLTELSDAFPWLTVEVAKKRTPSAAVAAGHLADVTIVPYSKLDGWAGYLEGGINTVVFDEVQELRNGIATVKGAAAALISEKAEYVMGLTATPVYNYGGEIWNIFDILAPDALGSREEFTREWGAGAAGRNGLMVGDPAALGSYLREAGVMLGRTRKEVGRELPKTIKVPMLIDSATTALDSISGDVEALARLILDDTATPQEKLQASGEISWKLRHATGVDKAPFVAEFVRLLLESEEKIVLFGWHRDVYDIWMDKLADFHPLLYTGSESPTQKSNAEDAFTKPYDPEDPTQSRILMMSLRSGAGVDGLQKVARVAVFGELDWSPATHEQAIGRLRRDGMGEDPPVAYFLNSAEGSDPIIMDVLQVKRQQAEPLVSTDGKLLGNATNEPNRARRLAENLLGITPTQQKEDADA